MNNPADAGLLIFDTDGTIVASLKPVYESIRSVFTGLGWPVTFTKTDIERYFGTPVGELYRSITPPGCGLDWRQVREKVIDEHETAFREFGHVFPGVPETLKALRERGYKLALCSNATVRYFNIVTSVFGLGEYFDYMECIEENGLAKPELVRKIAGRFGLVAAVVGDRLSDIEAARANGFISVGACYGYGGNEPQQADITIEGFGGLLDIFESPKS